MFCTGRAEILEFKEKFSIPHAYDKIYIKVFNERKTAHERVSKRSNALTAAGFVRGVAAAAVVVSVADAALGDAAAVVAPHPRYETATRPLQPAPVKHSAVFTCIGALGTPSRTGPVKMLRRPFIFWLYTCKT